MAARPDTPTLIRIPFLLALTLTMGVDAAFADETEERDVRDFDEVVFATSGELQLTQGREYVRIEADESVLLHIVTEVRNGRLVIRREGSVFRFGDGGPIRAYVGIEHVTALTVSGSGDLVAGKLLTDDIELNVSGSGSIDIEALEADDVGIKVTGSGNVNIADASIRDLDTAVTGSGKVLLAGEAIGQDVRISGSGDLRAGDLISRDVTVVVSGSGDVEVHAADQLDVAITGSGSVRYRGRPSVSQIVSGSGSVRAAN